MGETAEQRLAAMGIDLPSPAAPAANYAPFMQSGNLLFTAGQLPLKDGKLTATGLLGQELDTAAGAQAAKWCAVNILAQAKMALGSLDRIARIVKISVFVASDPGFTEQHIVANGASDLLELQVPGQSETVLLPFTRAAVPTVDLAGGRIVADPPDGLFADTDPE